MNNQNDETPQGEGAGDGEATVGNNTNNPPRTLRDYYQPSASDETFGIVLPDTGDAGFEYKPALISLVQQNCFHGHLHEDPNLHLHVFLECCSTIRIRGVPDNSVRVGLFQWSLKDRAKTWYWNAKSTNKFDKWEDLAKAFLARYFPYEKTAQVRGQLNNFKQQDGESLGEAWDRYKDLQRICPHHGIPDYMIVQNFYDGLTLTTKISVDTQAGGNLMDCGVKEANDILEHMALIHTNWLGRNAPKAQGKFEVSEITALTAKLDAMSARIEQLGKPNGCGACGETDHTRENCPLNQREDN